MPTLEPLVYYRNTSNDIRKTWKRFIKICSYIWENTILKMLKPQIAAFCLEDKIQFRKKTKRNWGMKLNLQKMTIGEDGVKTEKLQPKITVFEKLNVYRGFKNILTCLFQVREAPAPLNIPTPIFCPFGFPHLCLAHLWVPQLWVQRGVKNTPMAGCKISHLGLSIEEAREGTQIGRLIR